MLSLHDVITIWSMFFLVFLKIVSEKMLVRQNTQQKHF